MKTNYVLIDFENVQPESIAALDAEHFHVIVFCGANQTKVGLDLAAAMQKMGARARYLQIAGNGSNALDFHIAFYIGELATRDPAAFFHIISKDTGFDPLIAHLKSRKILSARSKSIADMPIFKAPAADPSTTQTAIAPTAPAVKHQSTLSKKVPTVEAKPIQSGSAASEQADVERIENAVENLSRRGNARPRTVKTLSSTLHALFNKKLSDSEIKELIDALVGKEHLAIDGTKVAYTLKAGK